MDTFPLSFRFISFSECGNCRRQEMGQEETTGGGTAQEPLSNDCRGRATTDYHCTPRIQPQRRIRWCRQLFHPEKHVPIQGIGVLVYEIPSLIFGQTFEVCMSDEKFVDFTVTMNLVGKINPNR
jgi:hypothetical protein